MPDLFGEDIAGTINEALGAQLQTGLLYKVNSSNGAPADPSRGMAPSSVFSEPVEFKGIIEDRQGSFQSGDTVIQQVEKIASMLGRSIVGGAIPAPGDKVSMNGIVAIIDEVRIDPALALYECVLKK